MNGYCIGGKCMCSPGYRGDSCEKPIYDEYFMDGILPLMGEGEDGWINGPDWNNAGGIVDLGGEGEAFTPEGDEFFSENDRTFELEG